jgi:cytochrome c553
MQRRALLAGGPAAIATMVAVVRLAAAVVLALGARTTIAADVSRAEALADACTSCHGINGRSQRSIPSLNTRSRAQLIQMLEAFRAQKQPATVMERITRTYTAAEIELLADYFSRGQKP